jgi:hypothetical protein
MMEIAFSIPVTGVVRIDEGLVTITVNRAETVVSVGEVTATKRISLGPGLTIYDVVLEAAREVVRNQGLNRFSAPELYSAAHEKYPQLKRGSFISRVIGSAPNHPSYRHYSSRRDYLHYGGSGTYQLEDKYIKETQSQEAGR